METKKNRKEAVLILKKGFYNRKAIKSAIRAYNGLADFECLDKKDKFEVKIKNIDKSFEKIIKDEFCNYILAEIKNG